MATNIITVFCEGPHDVDFLSKILKAAGYQSNDGCKIGEFPFPFNDLIQTEAKKSKIEELNLQELRRTLLPSATLKIRDHSLFEGKLKVGAFIFSKDGEETGKLEDILVPLMKQDNEQIFENAEGFIDRHYEESRCRGKKFDKGKSVIGTVGQLQKSGGSNVVCIDQTDYLTDEKVLNNAQCKEIITFFDQFIIE